MWRSLRYFWRFNLAIAAGAAVATAVLTGALVVGDSVSGSLRDLTLDRLGRIDGALVLDRFVAEDLAERVTEADGSPIVAAAPAVLLSGSATHDDGSRAAGVAIHGVDERFATMFPTSDGDDAEIPFDRLEGQLFPSVWLNASLARELNASVGDGVILAFGQSSDIPAETLIGEKEPDKVVDRLRLSVRGIVPDAGWGRFGIVAAQQEPLNAYVELDRLQRRLERSGSVNAIYAAYQTLESDPADAVRAAANVSDLGLQLLPNSGFIDLMSDEFVFRPALERQLEQALSDVPLLPVRSYLANAMRLGERSTPYSMVVAFPFDQAAASGWGDAEWASLSLDAGDLTEPLGDDEIVLDAWTAADLRADVGDRIELDYYAVEDGERLETETASFTVVAIAAMDRLAVDRDLTPEYPGIEEATDIADWDPPFPVDLDAVRDEDEEYWDDYGAAPKAFVSPTLAEKLWGTRFGSITSVRTSGDDVAALTKRLESELPAQLDPASLGLLFRPVKQLGLTGSQTANGFGVLFLMMSQFLIVSSILLVGLLFGLSIERRAREVGLRLAIGHPLARVRRSLLGEGTLLAALGGVVGVAIGVGYAALMMLGFRTIWRGAIGSSALTLHVNPPSLIAGWGLSVVVVSVTVFFVLRRLRKVPTPVLLAGRVSTGHRRGSGRPSRIVAVVAALLGIGMALGAAFGSVPAEALAGLTFGAAMFVLIAGLALFSAWCRRTGHGAKAALPSPLVGTAARNSAWSPGRSILSVALVASACFMIVAVQSFREGAGDGLERKDSRAGGFGLVAEAAVPLVQRLDRPEDRVEAGVPAGLLDGVDAISFRLLPGDDASCLNLYQPEKPRVLGVPDAMIDRGGFAFAGHLPLEDGERTPWDLLRRDLGEPGVVPALVDANSAQWILGVALGGDLEIEDEAARPLRLRIVGLFNKSLFQSELLVAESRFLDHFPSRTGYRYFLFDDAGEADEPSTEQRAELSRELERALEPFGLDATTTRDKIESYLVVEHTYISTFQALGGLGLLLGTIGLAIVMIRNVIERRGELATLRAFGYRRPRLGRMILVENAFLLFCGMLLGVGAAFVSIGPRLTHLRVPWSSLGTTLALVAAVGMLAAILAVRNAMRTPLIPALKAD